MDPKRVVAEGYDRVAERFLIWAARVGGDVRERYATILADGLSDGAAVLELGCGAGVPVAAGLARRFRVTGVDISRRQIELARRNVPNATFLHRDMTRLSLAADSFDAVAAFYALNHVPRDELGPLFHSIARWLRPGGRFVASLPTGSNPGSVEADWLSVPMFFSGHDRAASETLILTSGLAIDRVTEETIDEDGRRVTFVWVVARKPRGGDPVSAPPPTDSRCSRSSR
ncbi:MAG: methyltransferase domain-containing protein [Chloroflexota bacterium]|nr:methyltransferase domain-containing protein [Chloroflexota bacterium]